MKKIIALLSVSTVAVFLCSGSGDLSAQEKKKPATSSKTGTIELVESKDGKYRFSVRNSEGKYLAGSPVGHETEKEAREAAEELRSVIANAKYVSKKAETKKDKGDK